MTRADWDLRKLQQNLDRDGANLIYVLFGDETFLLDQAIQSIKAKVLGGEASEFNFDNFSAPEVQPAHVRDTTEMMPMLGSKRLIIYRNLDVLKDDGWEELFPVLENPVESAVIVLVAQKIDKRKKYSKVLAQHGAFVELKRPYDNQISMWVDYIAYLNSVKLAPDAASGIVQLVGTNLSEIHNEVQKVRQFLGNESRTVTLQDVMQVVSRARIESVFSLTDAIARQDRIQALSHLVNLLENGQNEFGILSLIHRHLRILSMILEGRREGLSQVKLMAKIGVPEYFLKQYLNQIRLWDEKKIASTIKVLHDTDMALKSSPVSSHIWMENLILKVCGSDRRSATVSL